MEKRTYKITTEVEATGALDALSLLVKKIKAELEKYPEREPVFIHGNKATLWDDFNVSLSYEKVNS